MQKVIQFSLFVLVTAWCCGCAKNANSPTSGASQSVESRSPKLWKDKDAEEIAQLFGYSQAFRWQGNLQGWLQFDAPDGKQQAPVDVKAVVDELVNHLRSGHNEYREKHKSEDEFSTHRISGLLLFTLKDIGSEETKDADYNWHQMKLIIKTTYTRKDGSTSFMKHIEGRVKEAKQPVDKTIKETKMFVKISGLNSISSDSKILFKKDRSPNGEDVLFGQIELVGETAK